MAVTDYDLTLNRLGQLVEVANGWGRLDGPNDAEIMYFLKELLAEADKHVPRDTINRTIELILAEADGLT